MLSAKERAKKVIREMENSPLLLPEGVTYTDWVASKIEKAIEEAIQDAISNVCCGEPEVCL